MRILLTVDGSSHSEVTLRFGAQMAASADEPATVLTVARHETDRQNAARILERAQGLLAPEVPEVQLRVRVGYPAAEIVREAEEGRYGLVVVGERPDRNLMRRVLRGSTALRVVEHAPCPVVVAKGKVGPIQRILLCASGAETLGAVPRRAAANTGSSVLSRFTAQLTDLLRGEEEIVVLHVMSQMSAGPGVRGQQLRAEVEELIESHTPEGELLVRDLRTLNRPGVNARPKVRHGLVVDEILTESRVGDYDLVVIGAYRGAGWQRILLDDLAHQIVIQLDRPVLVVR
jgi:nucleotide-binding universal stress UspA family protein